MSKCVFNRRGFIITLINTLTGDRISVYTDIIWWQDAFAYATDLLRLKQYSNCDLYSITRCIDYGKNL